MLHRIIQAPHRELVQARDELGEPLKMAPSSRRSLREIRSRQAGAPETMLSLL